MISLEQLIQRIPPTSYQGLRAGHYLYDPDRQELLDKLPWFGGRRLQYYQVVVSSSVAASASGELGPILIPLAATSSWLELRIVYRAWVSAANVGDLIRACAQPDAPPGQRLVARLIDIVQHVAGRDPGAFDRQDHSAMAALREEIQQLLLRQCGLNAILELRTDGDTAAPSIVTQLALAPVDYHAPLQLRVELETFLRNREKPQVAVALRGRPPQYLEQLVAQATRDALRGVGIAELRRGLHGALTERLRPELERALDACAIRVKAVHLSFPHLPPPPTAHHEQELTLELRPPGYPSALSLRAHLRLQLVAEGRYWSAGAPDLSTWGETHARPAAANALHGATYSQLCLEPQPWETRARGALEAAARAIGYELTATLHFPQTSAIRLLSPFAIEVEDIFATAVREVTTPLTITAQAQLDALSSVRSYLDHGIDLDRAFASAVHRELTAYLHTAQPGHVLLHFHQPLPITELPGANKPAEPLGVTVASILRDRVEGALRRFGLRLLSFTAKLGASQLSSVLMALQRSAIEFPVDAQLAEHVEPVTYLGAIAVSDVRPDDWLLFQRKQPSREEVSTAATRIMATLLEERTGGQRHGLYHQELRSIAYDRLPAALRSELGLTMTCVGWRRERGEDDAALAQHRRVLREDHFAEQLERTRVQRRQLSELLSRRKIAVLANDEEELALLDRQLAELKQESTGGATDDLEPPPPAPHPLREASP